VHVLFCFFLFLVVSTSAIKCLERLISEMTCYVSTGTLNRTHSLTDSPRYCISDTSAIIRTAELVTLAQTAGSD